MEKYSCFYVKKRTLLVIAGCVWLIAGFNVIRLGILSYYQLQSVSMMHILLSAVVSCLFGIMFYKISMKQTARILDYVKEIKPFWNFFDLKSYCIMAFMMGGGIWLRVSGYVPVSFIAVSYTGIGCALAFAGILFCWRFIQCFYDNVE